VKDSEAVGGVDTDPLSVSFDGIDTPWVGTQADKLYQQSGQFDSALKDSVYVGGIDTGPSGISHGDINERLNIAPPATPYYIPKVNRRTLLNKERSPYTFRGKTQRRGGRRHAPDFVPGTIGIEPPRRFARPVPPHPNQRLGKAWRREGYPEFIPTGGLLPRLLYRLAKSHPPHPTMLEGRALRRALIKDLTFRLSNTVNFAGVVSVIWDLTVVSNVSFNQYPEINLRVESAASNIGFGDATAVNFEITRSLSSNLGLEQPSFGPTTEDTASNSIAFSGEATRAADPSNDIIFGQVLSQNQSKGMLNDILFGQTVAPTTELGLSPSSNVNFGQQVLALIEDRCKRHEYDPQGGGLPTITFGANSGITLSCATDSITLPNPEFNNVEGSQVDRALNISRGGTPQITRDSQWTENTEITIDLITLTRTKALELLDFLGNCIGLLVTYIDHEDRRWLGIILNPEEAVTENRSSSCGQYSASIRMSLIPRKATKMIQQVQATPVTAVIDCSTVIPFDDTIPQNTEGDEVITVTITPNAAINTLEFEFACWGVKATGAGPVTAALFKDSEADAYQVVCQRGSVADERELVLRFTIVAGSTSPQTWKIRIGPTNNNYYVNGNNSGTRVFGGASAATFIVSEIEP
jgi:hypothetical protein